MSFICWTIHNKIEPHSEEFRLLENALAKTEYRLSKSGKKVSAFKGIRNISADSEPPYYVQSVFGDYRNTMEGLGLITSSNNLTENGKYIAGRFGRTIGGMPRNLNAAANNGFLAQRKSLLSLSGDEKIRYRTLFDAGGRKDHAMCRKQYSSLYIKMLRQTKQEIEDGFDNTQIDLVEKMKDDTKLRKSHPLAYAMFNYIYVVYCFTEAMHNLHDYLLDNRSINKIAVNEAANLRKIKNQLAGGMSINKNFAWRATIEEMKGLLHARSRNELMKKLIKRMQRKGDRAWLVMESGHIKLNPANPPVPKRVRPFGIRLAPFGSLMNDLKGR
jgi:hypothetical protein